ncbi:unknown [Prevotella sp. CAG:1092]|nr:unknown [Prevotella sp. CAG:1092]
MGWENIAIPLFIYYNVTNILKWQQQHLNKIILTNFYLR